MSLEVAVVNAKNLPNLGKKDVVDPYVELKFRQETRKTKHKSNNQNPEWNQIFTFDLGSTALRDNESLNGVIWDHEVFKDRIVGTFSHILQSEATHIPAHRTVLCEVLHKGKKHQGRVNLEIKYTPPDSVTLQTQDNVEDEDLVLMEGASVSAESRFSYPRGNFKNGHKLSKHIQNFLVRIKVWEGRQLEGSNINPLCKVSVSNHVRLTRVKKSTNRPYWNEEFSFIFKQSSADLSNEIIKFQVYNSRGKLRKDAVIGSFLLDVGAVYKRKNHAIENKWLVLTNADNEHIGGDCTGYLLVSLSVNGRADKQVQFKEPAETDHFDSNLLLPAGMEQQMGTLVVKIYNAEDIPQMDPGYWELVKQHLPLAKADKKGKVDPYLVFNFAGKEVRTDVIKASENPEWNEELRLAITFPSMCERIKLQMKDWDGVSAHDHIGTKYIDMSSILSPITFLPTFGPCFVNFYGSTREFSHFSDIYCTLNEGKGTGIAYRGRVMMSIDMKLGKYPYHQQQSHLTIEEHKVPVLEKVKYKYSLYCAFLDVTMMCESDDPVQFEVSIGSYRTKTEAAKAKKDGKYCFMPWTSDVKKPVVVINSEWEDVGFRLKLLNSLLRKVERLQSRHQKAKDSIQRKNTEEAKRLLKEMIAELASACCSEEELSKFNKLDLAKYTKRKNMADDAKKIQEKLDSSDEVDSIFYYLEEQLVILQEMLIEPQNSLPDVIIWMIRGKRRIAFHRIPAYHLLYADDKNERGKFCNVIYSCFLQIPGTESDPIGAEKIGARLRIKSWLGLERDRKPTSNLGEFSAIEIKQKSSSGYIGSIRSRKDEPLFVERDGWMECNYRNDVNDILTEDNVAKYQLRVHLYQAKGLLPSDPDGLADPIAYVTFLSQTKKSLLFHDTLSPVWNQTLVYDDILISEFTDDKTRPMVCIEVFDVDEHVIRDESEFLGRSLVPVTNQAKLAWHTLYKGNNTAGQLLTLCELCSDPDNTSLVQKPNSGSDRVYEIPKGILPKMTKTQVEIRVWGVRNMKGLKNASIEFEINNKKVMSDIRVHHKHKDISDTVLLLTQDLPIDNQYTPPINIKVYDQRAFGGRHIVGSTSITNLTPYEVERTAEEDIPDSADLGIDDDGTGNAPKTIEHQSSPEWEDVGSGRLNTGASDASPGTRSPSSMDTRVDTHETPSGSESDESSLPLVLPASSTSKESMQQVENDKDGGHENIPAENDVDWWSKYDASKCPDTEQSRDYKQMGLDTITIYDTELENVDRFKGFNDFCRTFQLYRGKQENDEDRPVVGEVKANFSIYPVPQRAQIPKRFTNLPLYGAETREYIIRVYIVKAIGLQPKDYLTNSSDPYIMVKLGKTKISDEENYIANDLNPTFGKMFEIKTTQLSVHKDLKVSVWDHDAIGPDDFIGETTIDLENRVLTKYRATCGLAQSYNLSGPNTWRDLRKPTEILANYRNKIPSINLQTPENADVGTSNGNTRFRPEEQEDGIENKAANEKAALKQLHMLHLVPEHIETRSLYNPVLPGIEQGKLEMFVDIFPLIGNRTLPPPIDISPRQPRKYVLRCVIWNVKDVKLDDTTIFGETMSDIFVTGWLGDPYEKQKTDVHYRSLNGKGSFNWRFVFPFEYIPQEKMMVIRKKDHFWSLDKRECREPPVFRLQLWDNDWISPNDWLGDLELPLTEMQSPSKRPGSCSDQGKRMSLFKKKHVSGWWPCKRIKDGKESVSKIEMTMDILTEEEAEQLPAGQGRSEPNANPKLDPPERPNTSFVWFQSPWRTFKYIIWQNVNKYIIGGIILFLITIFVVVFIYSIPKQLATKLLN